MKLKSYFAIAIVFCALLGVYNTFGQNTNQNNPNVASNNDANAEKEKLTAEQIQQAKKLLEQLVDEKKQSTTGTSSTPQNKTMADVLDKGIDLFAGYVTSVSDMIQKIAPDVWRIMIRQQYAKAISGVILPLMLLLTILTYYRVAKKWFKLGPDDKMFDFEDDYTTGRTWFLGILPAFASVVCGVWFAISFSYAVLILINPEYYALKDLLNMILGGKSM